MKNKQVRLWEIIAIHIYTENFMASNTPIHILLIDDNPIDAAYIKVIFSNVLENSYTMEWVKYFSDGITRLQSAKELVGIDVVLVDLTYPNDENLHKSLTALAQLIQLSPTSSILVLENNDARGQTFLAHGANDYLLKSRLDGDGLLRSLRYLTHCKEHELVVLAAEKALYEEKERSEVTLNTIGDAVLATDHLGNITYINHAAEVMTGWSKDNALGRPISEIFNIVDGMTRGTAINPALGVIQQSESGMIEMDGNSILIRYNGTECSIKSCAKPTYNCEGNVTGAIIIFHDVSDSRIMALKMTHLAQHDFLTGLPNRLLLTERLSQAMGLAQRNRTQVALLFIDLDFFKHINDSLGHAVGDDLLKSVAERLVSCVRATDTVCRQGGDEFVILLTEIERDQDVVLTAEKIFACFAEPHLIDVHELHITLSIGVSVYPSDGQSAETLMQNADAAMYYAKAIGRNNYQFFRMEMNERAMQRSFIEASLRRAIRQQEFVLHYQPKIDIASGTIVGVEALIRWQNPKLGLIYPPDFLAIAEECGLIIPIGNWVLRQACSQLRAWLKAGLRIIPVAVNVSAAELKHKYFLDGVAKVLQDTGLPPYYLEMEFTETILMRDAELSVSVLEALKEIGLQLSIDDFGTGYSSLTYLKRFPVDTLKIDSSFMHNLSSDTDNATIVSAIIAMGKNLKQKVLAEGVETAEQFIFLRNQRCNEAQGFYLSDALPAEEFEKLLITNAVSVLSVRQRTDQAAN